MKLGLKAIFKPVKRFIPKKNNIIIMFISRRRKQKENEKENFVTENDKGYEVDTISLLTRGDGSYSSPCVLALVY